MKNITKQFVALIIVGLVSITAKASIKTPDTFFCLELSGKILKLKKYASNTYTINLSCDNAIIETKIVKGNNEFKFNLKKNGLYTVKILKEGYVSRTISVDTKLAEEHDGLYKFAFDTELIEEAEAVKLNKNALEMPIAHIYYDRKKHWFTHNIAYTNEVKNKIYCRQEQLSK